MSRAAHAGGRDERDELTARGRSVLESARKIDPVCDCLPCAAPIESKREPRPVPPAAWNSSEINSRCRGRGARREAVRRARERPRGLHTRQTRVDRGGGLPPIASRTPPCSPSSRCVLDPARLVESTEARLGSRVQRARRASRTRRGAIWAARRARVAPRRARSLTRPPLASPERLADQVKPRERAVLPPEAAMDPRLPAQRRDPAVGLPHGHAHRSVRRARRTRPRRVLPQVAAPLRLRRYANEPARANERGESERARRSAPRPAPARARLGEGKETLFRWTRARAERSIVETFLRSRRAAASVARRSASVLRRVRAE